MSDQKINLAMPIRVLRSMHVCSELLGVHGIADIVELHGTRSYPVEYKRGRPKAHRADEVQLCAQGLCLEEMTGQDVPEGALFYGARRRRHVVSFDSKLRDLTRQVAVEARSAMAVGDLPLPIYDPGRCESCSLKERCCPQARQSDVSGWVARRLVRAGIPE